MPDHPHGVVREIDERWNERLLEIVRNSPVESPGLEIVFDRRPDVFLVPRLRSRALKCAGFFVGDRLSGFAMMLKKDVRVGGEVRSASYFGSLHIEPAARRRGFFYQLSDFFLGDPAEEDALGYAAIMQGNAAAGRLLNRFHPRYPHMPHSRVIGQWRVMNILLALPARKRPSWPVRRARMEDVDAIAGLLRDEYALRSFSPMVSRESVLSDLENLPHFGIGDCYVAERDRKIAGVCCAWDMTPVKQNRVLRYGKGYARARRIHRLFGLLFGAPKLPAAGEAFRDVTITDYAVQGRNPEILRALLAAIHREYREKRYHLMILGCAADDPISAAARGFWSRSHDLDILIFSRSEALIDGFQDRSLPWLDMALL
jgi:hypothetical protein